MDEWYSLCRLDRGLWRDRLWRGGRTGGRFGVFRSRGCKGWRRMGGLDIQLRGRGGSTFGGGRTL